MTTKYLLPCPKCRPGTHVEIDASQSGLTVNCTCGAELLVPTLRGIKELERVERISPAERPSTWTWRQSMVLLGAAVAAATVPLFAYVWDKRPPHPSTWAQTALEDAGSEIDSMSPDQLFGFWELLRTGPDVGDDELLVIQKWERLNAENLKRVYMVLGVTGLGLALAAIGGTAALLQKAGRKGAC